MLFRSGEKLLDEGISSTIVSMASMDVFEKQSDEYKNSVLDPKITKRISVEAASTMGWHKYIKDGKAIGMEGFGASAPGNKLFEKFGFTVDNIINQVKDIIK